MTPDRTLPEIVAEYVREKVEQDVEDLLDDPHGVFETMGPQDIVLHMQNLDRVAELARISLSELISKTGSDFEFRRLMQVILKAREAC